MTEWAFAAADEERCHAALDDEGIQGQSETAHISNDDGSASYEIICDCCRGRGHMRRVCPSNRNRQRTLDYAIGMLKSKLEGKGKGKGQGFV